MNANQKAEIVTSLINSVRDDILDRIKYMPEEWNGIELRQYIADKFAQEAGFMNRTNDRQRFRSYRNETATRMGL